MMMLRMNRRHFLGVSGSAAVAACLPGQNVIATAFAEVPTGKALHGLSAFGELKYGSDLTTPIQMRRKAAHSSLPRQAGSGTRTRRPSTRSAPLPSKAMRPRAWS
jgi:microcin C transport system substrate-binding protein